MADALAADLVRKGWLTPAGSVERGAPDRLPIASYDDRLLTAARKLGIVVVPL